ncbi:baseplate J/gp47 family protein [Lentibacillus sp. N15]|uniref:baseplate J/gp47 family protein n=1 Tax=Lentibacillus songyuanensis TaxID=3136161 RepID=UPI0031B9D046
MFDNISPESLLEDMLDEVSDEYDKREGSVIFNALAPAAVKLFETYISLEQVLVLAFPQTSEGEYLEKITAGEGVERILATPSTRHFKAEGTDGEIEQGTRFFVDGIYFVAQKTVELPVTFKAISEEKGADTAIYDPDTILPVDADIDGLESISMVSDHENDVDGIDDESDSSLLKRYWEKIENSPGPGNVADYIRWSKEIAGVGNVLVEPLWKGDGTIRVVILTPDGKQATPALIEEVQELIDPDSKGVGEGKAPVGAKVTVATAKVMYITATIPDLQIEQGYTADQVQSNIEDALHEYLSEINPGGVVRIKEAVSVVINASGVLDIGDILLNEKRENITLDITELANLGEVTYP